MNRKKTQIGILAPGAIGGFLAIKLACTKQNLLCVTRTRNLATLKQSGLTLISADGASNTFHPEFVTQLEKPVDYLFITCKAHQLVDALKRIKPHTLDNKIVIPLQNGIEHLALLRKALPEATVLAANIGKIEVKRDALDRIIHVNKNATIQFALQSIKDQNKLEKLTAILESAGITTELLDTEAETMWGKLIRLNALSLTTAVTNWTLGEILADRYWHNKLETIVKENLEVAAVYTSKFSLQNVMQAIHSLPANLKTSLQRDVNLRHYQGELDTIAGSVLRIANKHNIHCSTINELYQLIKTRLENHA